jgi:hypothetical protein
MSRSQYVHDAIIANAKRAEGGSGQPGQPGQPAADSR